MQAVSSVWKAKQELKFVPESYVQLTVVFSNGMTVTFTKHNIMSFEYTAEADLLAGSVGKNQISFVLDNSMGLWDITNPSNLARYLTSSAKVTVSYGLNVGEDSTEWIKGGTFFLSEWDTPANGREASFTAVSALGYMTDTYVGTRVGTLREIAIAAVTQNSLPNGETAMYVFDSSLNDISVDISQDDTEYSCAELLQVIANAACCVLYCDRSGIVRIRPLSRIMTDYVISKGKSYQYPECTLSHEIRKVEVTGASGKTTVNVGDVGGAQTVTNPLIPNSLQARLVGIWTADMLSGRKTLKGSFRVDPRLDVLDRVTVEHKSGLDSAVVITSVNYSFQGAWRATFEGRIIEPVAAAGNAGESYAMGDGDIIFTTQEVVQ